MVHSCNEYFEGWQSLSTREQVLSNDVPDSTEQSPEAARFEGEVFYMHQPVEKAPAAASDGAEAKMLPLVYNPAELSKTSISEDVAHSKLLYANEYTLFVQQYEHFAKICDKHASECIPHVIVRPDSWDRDLTNGAGITESWQAALPRSVRHEAGIAQKE
ncbi:uncharacterized protein RHO25_011338 [Cercospora beticola]|uniref:Uncharacterized protein n=1 Tax=Cercospora beticola TaxID=122368 RepID=A0ABZ0P558_CERBT|nr:hypothetical protein RHO25_011338 [Cercospora beticola]